MYLTMSLHAPFSITAIKDMASNISKKWRKQIDGGQEKNKDTSSSVTLKKVEIEGGSCRFVVLKRKK